MLLPVFPWRISHIQTWKVTFLTFRLRFSVIFCNIKKNRDADGEGFDYEEAHLSSCSEPEAFFFCLDILGKFKKRHWQASDLLSGVVYSEVILSR